MPAVQGLPVCWWMDEEPLDWAQPTAIQQVSLVRLQSCSELSMGGYIEARAEGVVHFRGWVTDAMPSEEIFWATDDIGHRRIIDFREFEVHG